MGIVLPTLEMVVQQTMQAENYAMRTGSPSFQSDLQDGYRLHLQEQGIEFADDEGLQAYAIVTRRSQQRKLAANDQEDPTPVGMTREDALVYCQYDGLVNHQRLEFFAGSVITLTARSNAISNVEREGIPIADTGIVVHPYNIFDYNRALAPANETKRFTELRMIFEGWGRPWFDLCDRNFPGYGFSEPLDMDQIQVALRTKGRTPQDAQRNIERVGTFLAGSVALSAADQFRGPLHMLGALKLLQPYGPKAVNEYARLSVEDNRLSERSPAWQLILDQYFTEAA